MSNKYELALDELSILVDALPKKGALILRGNLASGKTTLAKAIVKSNGKNESVTSPTFSVMQNYGDIYHYDLYRVCLNDILQNGLFENLFEDGLHIVEWGDDELIKLLKKYEIPVCVVEISGNGDKRIYEVEIA